MINNKTFNFGTKTETLQFLQHKLKQSIICDIVSFTIDEFETQPDVCLSKILELNTNEVIVRSSALNEDQEQSTMAGFYESVTNVSLSNKSTLINAITTVIKSYSKSAATTTKQNQILIQPMIKDVSMSGVIFTQELNTGAPYYVINYDDESGRTDTITSGDGITNKTVFILRSALHSIKSTRIKKLLPAIQEIESIISINALDIEFAVTHDETIYIFQVRPLTTKANWHDSKALEVEDNVKRIAEFIESKTNLLPEIFGQRSIFGQMPDWNPVEMIGLNPRPMALSLYKYLITDKTWRIARRLMGYSEPSGAHLMSCLCGKPYIDTRMSFHSFTPQDLDPNLKDKLVNIWLNRLEQYPELHDKIEFEIAITAYTLDIDNLIDVLMPDMLNSSEKDNFKTSLLHLTDSFINGKHASIKEQLNKISLLKEKLNEIDNKSLNSSPILALQLLEYAIDLGTLPFSILARHAFIAKALLDSLESCGVLSKKDISNWMTSIKTIAGTLVEDAHLVKTKQLNADTFMTQYGHLRPGTYDILSLRYDQRPSFLNNHHHDTITPSDANIQSKKPLSKLSAINHIMKKHGFKATADELLFYIEESIKGRELAKFIFTRAISNTLEVIADFGKSIGLSRNELSFLDIKDILDIQSVADGRTLKHSLQEKSAKNHKKYKISQLIHLPHLIVRPEDVMIVPLIRCRPNFITHQHIHAQLLFLDGHGDTNINSIKNTIIMIESADPGFDWIFTQGIKGLVTKYGGANSHMAIRCAELGIPAAIGCGEQIFERLLAGKAIELDTAKGLIKPTL